MEKITSEYEELKKVYEGMKCPKDDKIQALRSTARALEAENELLVEEKRKVMVDLAMGFRKISGAKRMQWASRSLARHAGGLCSAGVCARPRSTSSQHDLQRRV